MAKAGPGEQASPSPAFMRLVELARAAGDEPRVTRDEGGTAYHFSRVMPLAVREAGLRDGEADYLRSAESDPPEEGFVDPNTDTWMFFPVDPEHDVMGPLVDGIVSEHRRPAMPARLCLAAGCLFMLLSLIARDGFRAPLFVIGALLLVVAFAVRRRV